MDTSVILLSGHATTSASGHYFVPVEVHPDRLTETAVSGREIEARLSRIQGRVLVFLDSDFVGITNVQQATGQQAQVPRLPPAPGTSSAPPTTAAPKGSRPAGERDQADAAVLNASVLKETGVAIINAASPGQSSMELSSVEMVF